MIGMVHSDTLIFPLLLLVIIAAAAMPITWSYQCTDPNNPKSGRWVWKLDKPDELVLMPEYMYFYAPPQYILVQIPAASASRMTPTKAYIAQSHTTITDSMGFLRELADKWTTVYDMTELSWLSAHWIPHRPIEQPNVVEPNEPVIVDEPNEPIIEDPIFKIKLVCITQMGIRYHRLDCRYAKNAPCILLEEEAIAAGYTPCSVCRPDKDD